MTQLRLRVSNSKEFQSLEVSPDDDKKFTSLTPKQFPFKIFSILFALAFIVRLFRLSIPSEVVFDEVHYAKFARLYIKGEFFMDFNPPFGKLLYALAGYFVGLKADSLPLNSGDSYIDSQFPFVALRMLPAIFGVLMVPIAYLTMRGLRTSEPVAIVTALFILFDNALNCQSRLILLDSILLFFTGFSTYCWVQLQRNLLAFTAKWWIFLVLTGVSLGLCVSVQWAGLYTVAFIGFFAVLHLWNLICNAKNSIASVVKQALAFLLVLVILPISIYLLTFQIHFSLIKDTTGAIGILSPAFMMTLKGSPIPDTFKDVAYGSKVYLRHDHTSGGLLHSHKHYYPTGSKQQQVTVYAYRDMNSLFEIKYPLIEQNSTYSEKPIEGFQKVKHGDIVRLEHVATSKRLHSHNHRPPVTEKKTHNEVSCYGDPSDKNFIGDSNDHWVVQLEGFDPEDPYLYSMHSKFRLMHVNTACLLFSHDLKLPDWAFKQQEVSCATDGKRELTFWRIEHNEHAEMPETIPLVNYKRLTFVDMITEIHRAMLKMTKKAKATHAFASKPLSWPLLDRGIRYWKDSRGEIYFIGNPMIWWLACASIFFYCVHECIGYVLEQRAIQGLGNCKFFFFMHSSMLV